MRTPTRNNMGRPADRMAKIVAGLRGEIVDGTLEPGTRIPTRVDVERRYEASPVTVQRALNQLAKEGFVRVDRTLATYVTDTPPHLGRYAIVFPQSPKPDGKWNLWYDVLLRSSAIVAAHRGISIEPFFRIDLHLDTPSYIHLVDNIQSSRLAGLILSVIPHRLLGTPIMDHAGLPRVVAVGTDMLSSVGRSCEAVDIAMQSLADSGRRKVAVFANSTQDSIDFARKINHYGMETRPYWIQPIDLGSPQTAMNVVSLLMSPENSVHPDAIYIDDDNLTDPIVAGLLGAGVRVPTDLELVAHTNLPIASKSLVPVRRFGVDARMVISRCVDILERQRTGEVERQHAKVPCISEVDILSDREVSLPHGPS